VDDEATFVFMRLFYDALLSGKVGPAAALSFARSRMAGEARWADPHYYGAFELIGESR
jgi:CHAT domain-containing protein